MAIKFINELYKQIEYTDESYELIKKYVDENTSAKIYIKLNDLLKSKKSESLYDYLSVHNDAWVNITDYESFDDLGEFKKLKNLGINDQTIKDNKKPKVDLSNFPELTWFSCNWNPKITNIGELHKLKQFNLFLYKPKSKDLTELATLKSLENLKLGSGNYESLKGLDKLKNLKTLRIYSNRFVKSDESVILESVQELYIGSCKSYDHNFYKSFPNLKTLDIESSIELESLKPILDNLKNLKEINICGTKVLEEENTYWKDYKNITMFNFNNRKHHKLKNKDFENYPYDKNGKWKGIPRTIIE
ncbi:hypothetical protein [Olleya sp. R77988]|uniref:hypothetical protein n=1 Tax=Olleya sp. R77988 TaxID=3093875 RepID=UPI0037C9EA31